MCIRDRYYKIEPGIDDWSLAENGSVNFSGLEYGDYSVKVKGRNNLTGGFSKPYFLLLHIDPHWYQTNFFKLILLAAIIALVLILFKRRVMTVFYTHLDVYKRQVLGKICLR